MCFPVIVVLHPVDRVDVLGLEVSGNLLVVEDVLENGVQFLVGKVVIAIGKVDAAGILVGGRIAHSCTSVAG